VHRSGSRVERKIGDIVLQPGDTLLLQTGPHFQRAHRNDPAFYLVSDMQDWRPLRRERAERRALREKLNEMAITDPLTGLYNRRHFEEILRAEISRIRRYGGHCSLAMIDLDFFKNYNDTLGHLAGDALLKELAALMMTHLRVSDVFARYGGEEFGLIMINTPRDEAILAMERLRVMVEGYPFRGGSIQPFGRLTVSVGVAGCPEDGLEYEDLVRKADAALYAAKRLGRNRVQVAVLA
jgi:diguanylate cyclase (GGDEF)-like protein